MRRRDRYGYHTYYGGGGPSPVIKVIVIVLAVVVLSLILTIWGLQRYMVYSSDGGKLVLPWSQQTGGSEGSAQPEEGAVTSEPDISDVVTSGSAAPQEPAAAEQTLQAVRITQEELLNGNVSDLLEQRGANGVVLEMKSASGQLSYASSLNLATQLGTSAQATTDPTTGAQTDPVAEAVKELKNQGVYTIAYVDCFEDGALGNLEAYAILTNSGYRWKGPNNDVRWGSPTNADVRNYLTGIIEELAAIGFDEILLDNAGYPTAGNLNYIRKGDAYNYTQFASVIGNFYTQAAQAASNGGAKLSVITDQNTITSGSNSLSGQTLENLASLNRVWLELAPGADATDLTRTLTEAGMNDHPLGVLTTALETGKDYCQAVLTTQAPAQPTEPTQE